MSATLYRSLASDTQGKYAKEMEEAFQCLTQAFSQSDRPIVSTKFSPDSAVLLHLVTRLLPDIPVVWVDTGYNSRDTIRFAEYLKSSLSLNLQTYRPAQADLVVPPSVDSPAHDAFTRTVKLEPFQKAFLDLKPDLWVSSLRRYQSPHRATLSRHDVVDCGLTKVLPILEWSEEVVEWYRMQNDLPLGPDAYDPTKGLPLRECGLHTIPWRATA